MDRLLEETVPVAASLRHVEQRGRAEIERTCDRAAIIKDGSLAAVKNIHELQSVQRKLVAIVFERAEDALRFAAADGLRVVETDGSRVVVAVQGDCNALVRETARYPIRSLDIAAQNLEDVFMHYYDRKEADSR